MFEQASSPTRWTTDPCLRNQILLRVASIELLSRDGQGAKPVAKRVLDLKEPSRVSENKFTKTTTPNNGFNASGFPEVLDFLQLQADLEDQREDIARIDSNGTRIISSLDTRVVRIEDSVTKLKDSFGQARRDITGVQDDLTLLKEEVNTVKRANPGARAVSGLEEKLRFTDTALDQLRQDVGSIEQNLCKEVSAIQSELRQQKQEIETLKVDLKGRVPARDHAKDMAALRTEMLQMRRQMDELRNKPSERVVAPAHFPSKEIDILTSTIAKIGARASQVETLQMEFEILKGRVERAEASRLSPDDRLPPEPRDPQLSYANGLASQRKRTSSTLMKSQEPDSASKRPAFSSNHASTPAQLYDGPSEENEQLSPALKLTKTGKIDKRSQRTRKTGSGKIR